MVLGKETSGLGQPFTGKLAMQKSHLSVVRVNAVKDVLVAQPLVYLKTKNITIYFV